MTLSADQFDFVRRLLEAQVGISLEADQRMFVAHRLLPITRQHGWTRLDPLLARLRDQNDRMLTQQVIESLVTHETAFFRDAHYFDELAERVLPQLISHRARERRLAIWCAACSTGQEAYSVSMILRERFAEQLRGWNVELLATDVSSRALDQARSGRYSAVEVRRGLSAERLARHFRRESSVWRIDDRLRQMVRLQQLNLLNDSPEVSAIDLVLLRNVLIYMTPAAQQTVLTRLQHTLHPEGTIMLGSTEVSGVARQTMPRSILVVPSTK
jgi:chemotaxis protein methyltransferase CheR